MHHCITRHRNPYIRLSATLRRYVGACYTVGCRCYLNMAIFCHGWLTGVTSRTRLYGQRVAWAMPWFGAPSRVNLKNTNFMVASHAWETVSPSTLADLIVSMDFQVWYSLGWLWFPIKEGNAFAEDVGGRPSFFILNYTRPNNLLSTIDKNKRHFVHSSSPLFHINHDCNMDNLWFQQSWEPQRILLLICYVWNGGPNWFLVIGPKIVNCERLVECDNLMFGLVYFWLAALGHSIQNVLLSAVQKEGWGLSNLSYMLRIRLAGGNRHQ